MQDMVNVSRLHALMDEQRISAVIVRSGKNITYLSGVVFPGTLARHLDLADSPRANLLVWPRRGDPVLFCDQLAGPLASRESWIDRIEVFVSLDSLESPYRVFARLLGDLGLDGERLGIEMQYVNAAGFAELSALMPRARLEDCSELMDRVRAVKTPGELEVMTDAANQLDDAYLDVFPTIRDGDTEREVHSRIVEALVRRGAQGVHGILNSSRNATMYGGESEFVIRSGDIVRNDYAAYFRGYPGHLSRVVAVGKPSPAQIDKYRVYRAIQRKTIDRCRAGETASSVARFANDEFDKAGIVHRYPLVGHGIGVWFHQQAPLITRTCNDVLEEGMTLAMEPSTDYWILQDLVVVTGSGPVIQSRRFDTEELFVA
jgi:Xaa-Pro aminopeptidase